MTKKASPSKADRDIRVNEKKWGTTAVELGWTLLPNILLERQAVLGINSTQLNIILIILKHWWEAEQLPFPEMNTIAKMMGCSRSTVQKNIRALEQMGFIKRIERKSTNGGNKSNMYDFTGLVEHLKPYAEDERKERETAKKAKEARHSPKGNKPGLKVVK